MGEREPDHVAGRRTPKGGSWGRSAPAPMTAAGRERRAEVFHKTCDSGEFCTTKHHHQEG